MKFNNLERNILYLLGNQWIKSGTLGPFGIKLIFDKYSDIPDNSMKNALKSIKERGFVKLTSNYDHISLTQKGLSKIKVIHSPEDGSIPVPKELD